MASTGLQPPVLRVVALNVRLGGGRRVGAIVDSLAALEPHVVVLSEFSPTGRGPEFVKRLDGIGLTHHASGVLPDPRVPDTVCIASSPPLSDVRHPLGGSPNGHRVIEARVRGVDVVGVYFPLGEPKVAFWRDEFLPFARQRLGEDALLVGDWNSGSHHLDEAGATLDGAAEFEAISAMGWCDAWRTRNPEGREFTWYSNHGNGFRLDHAFLSPSLMPRLASVRYAHETRRPGVTDHSAMVVELR